MTETAQFSPQFTEVAPYYDQLMAHVPYDQWADYVEKLFGRFRARPKAVADLACGTGNVTFELARRGYEMTGFDNSASMLAEARRKAASASLPVDFFFMDLRRLVPPRQFDAAVCLYDSLNYLSEPAELSAAFRGVRALLAAGGLFVFDLNAEYAFEAELFTQDNFRYREELKYSWKSSYNPSTRLCQVEMYFEIEEDGAPRRFRERHVERCYSTEEVHQRLREASLLPLATFEAYSFRKPRAASERLFFVARADQI